MVNVNRHWKFTYLYLFLNVVFSSTDMWGLGCLVWESYNGPLQNRSNLKDMNEVILFIFSDFIYF